MQLGRGSIVTVAMQGDFGKPRPALVVQADQFDALSSVTVLLITSTIMEAPMLRVPLAASVSNGLAAASQIMVDKAMTIRRDKIGVVVGQIEANVMVKVELCLAIFLGIVK